MSDLPELRTQFRVYDIQEKRVLDTKIICYLNTNGTIYVLDGNNTMTALPSERFVVENAYLNQGNGVTIMDFIFLAGQLLGSISGDKKKELESMLGVEVVAQLIDVLTKVEIKMRK